MEKRFVSRDVLDWLTGIFVVLLIILKSLLLSVLFLIPVFFIWKEINLTQVNISEEYRDKKINRSTMWIRKGTLGIFGLILFAAFILFLFYWKTNLEFYWLKYIAIPGVTAVGNFFNGIVGVFHDMFGGWMSSAQSTVANFTGGLF